MLGRPDENDVDCYFTNMMALARYSGYSISFLQKALKDPVRPIPHVRIGNRINVKRSDYDAWVADARARPRAMPAKVEESRPRGVKSQTELAEDAAAAVRSIRGGR